MVRGPQWKRSRVKATLAIAAATRSGVILDTLETLNGVVPGKWGNRAR
jgi:hypothetical protein